MYGLMVIIIRSGQLQICVEPPCLWFGVSWAVTQMCGQTRPGVFRRIIPILIVPQASESLSDGHYPASLRVSIHHCPLTPLSLSAVSP